MAKKKNIVTLIANGRKQSFALEHAETLLKMPNNGGWGLPKDSDYELDSKNGLIKRSQGKDKGGQ